MVGDEDQSIYSWRGANIKNILEFEKDFPGAKIIRLEQNYRSTQVILEAASAVVANNKQRKGKNLWTERQGGAQDRLLRSAGWRERIAVRRRLHPEVHESGASRATEDAACCGAVSHELRSRDCLKRRCAAMGCKYNVVGGIQLLRAR